MQELSSLITLAKSELIRSNVDRKHPFRYFTLATFGDYPEVRTVVKRGVDTDFTLLFFTDSRSPKMAEIEADNRVSALFYHPKKQLQIRLKGRIARIDNHSETYQAAFRQLKQGYSLKDYTTGEAPGSPLPTDSDLQATEEIHFAVMRIEAEALDILQLGRDTHQRASYTKNTKGEWEEMRLVP